MGNVPKSDNVSLNVLCMVAEWVWSLIEWVSSNTPQQHCMYKHSYHMCLSRSPSGSYFVFGDLLYLCLFAGYLSVSYPCWYFPQAWYFFSNSRNVVINVLLTFSPPVAIAIKWQKLARWVILFAEHEKSGNDSLEVKSITLGCAVQQRKKPTIHLRLIEHRQP